jgi:DnaJ like chaperone protein
MSWIGKLGGGLLGLAAGGPIGAAIGVVLGHQFDRGLVLNGGQGRLRDDDSSAVGRQRVFFETTFLVMGHLAKVDGRVSQTEIQAAREVMRRMRLEPRAVQFAIELFNRGKQADLPIDMQVERLRRACAVQPELLRTFLEIQMDLALSKGHISPPEHELLWRVAGRLGVGRVELAQLEAILRARRFFDSGQPPPNARSEDALAQAYRVLGVTAEAPDKDVKTAYRRLINQHHPDKQVARGLPDSMMEIAKERTREIRAAYELIRDRRGMK